MSFVRKSHLVHVLTVLFISSLLLGGFNSTVRSRGEVEDPSFLEGGACSGLLGIPLDECLALDALYTSTDGPSWINNTDWVSSNPHCTWYGVTCTGGFVTGLSLVSNNLTGPLPIQLTNLTHLEGLWLTQNNLTGSIPTFLPISLKYLMLGRNDFTGPIPADLKNLVNLVYLFLDRNDLAGPIPPQLSDLDQLERLNLFETNLTGTIPDLSNLTSLRILDLSNNDLTGHLPAWLGDLDALEILVLQSNNFDGIIPAEIGSLPNLYLLYMHTIPDLRGAIPIEWTALNLDKFFFSATSICVPHSGQIYDWLGSISSVGSTGIDCPYISLPIIVH